MKKFILCALIAFAFFEPISVKAQQFTPILQVIKQAVVNPNTPAITTQVNAAFDGLYKTYANSWPALTYIAKISQSTVDSTISIDTVLINTLGVTPTIAKTSAGLFTISSATPFAATDTALAKQRVFISLTNGFGSTNKGPVGAKVLTGTKIQVQSLVATTATDLVIKDAWIEWKIFQ